jgi:predicted transglutaminase-like cysteine proteinase
MTLFEKLTKIHKDVKKRFVYKPDDQLQDYWPSDDEIPDNSQFLEDCDGFALACRKECKKQHIKSRLVLCVVETGEIHLVLEVQGWILDNRQNRVMSKDELDERYKWLTISGYTKNESWKIIKNNHKVTL